jgi:uncharacterized protein YjfI (DUF2170 family)
MSEDKNKKEKETIKKSKQQKSMEELSERLGTHAIEQMQEIANQTQQQRQQQVMQTQMALQNPYQKLSNNVNNIVDQTRQQQMQSEQQIQSTLNQASTSLADANNFEQIFNLSQQLQQITQQGITSANINQCYQIIDQLEKHTHNQMSQFNKQLVQTLQQAISSMAQAQQLILQSHTANNIYSMLNQCEETLKQIDQTQPDLTVH